MASSLTKGAGQSSEKIQSRSSPDAGLLQLPPAADKTAPVLLLAQAQILQAPSAAPSTLQVELLPISRCIARTLPQEQSLLDTLMAEAPQDPAKKGQAPPEATSRFSPGAHEHEFSVTSVLALSKLLRN